MPPTDSRTLYTLLKSIAIEFRQHSATMNYEKVSSWIRFCIFFCWNSATLQSPTPFKESSSLEKKMNGLFQFVIKDRALRNFYRKRQLKLANGEADDCGCCSQCNSDSGAPCASTPHWKSFRKGVNGTAVNNKMHVKIWITFKFVGLSY